MFLTFKKVRGYTPMCFLNHIRLEHARRLLKAPDETTSITAVGLMCGFYDELPSLILAMARNTQQTSRYVGWA
jgi:transcriptional regulator GlxA family with amidase domain